MTTSLNPQAANLAAQTEYGGVSASTPLLLLPVHIQTRFIDGEQGIT